jgi:hypothetical protein
VLTPVPGATRLRVVGAARTQRMGHIRFRCIAVIPPVTVLSLRKIDSSVESVDVTEMAKLRDAKNVRLVTLGTQSNFKMGTSRRVSQLVVASTADCVDTVVLSIGPFES